MSLRQTPTLILLFGQGKDSASAWPHLTSSKFSHFRDDLSHAPEEVFTREETLDTVRTVTSPDLIQDLPRTGAIVPGLLGAVSGGRTSEDRDNANDDDDDDYVEADSVALDASEQEDNDICPSGHGVSVHQDIRTMSPTDLDRAMETGSADNGVRSKDTR